MHIGGIMVQGTARGFAGCPGMLCMKLSVEGEWVSRVYLVSILLCWGNKFGGVFKVLIYLFLVSSRLDISQLVTFGSRQGCQGKFYLD